jgi:hypothetical protein
MNEVKQKEVETHRKLQKSLTFAKNGLKEKIGENFYEISENVDNSLLDVKTFREWIKSSQNVAALVDVSEKPQIFKLLIFIRFKNINASIRHFNRIVIKLSHFMIRS